MTTLAQRDHLGQQPSAPWGFGVLADPKWAKKLTAQDRRALNALFWTNINPYGRFQLDMDTRLDLDLAA